MYSKLIVAKELKISNARYTVPKPYFIVIAVLPRNSNRSGTSSQLVCITCANTHDNGPSDFFFCIQLDRFFVSYDFNEEAFASFGTPRGPVRRTTLMKNEVKFVCKISFH